MTTRIAILGANGQVGAEVSLLLSRSPNVQVVPVVRTELGTAFLARLGLDCVVGRLHDPVVLKHISECDVVADFTLPHGLHSEVREEARQNIRTSIDACRPGARYVFISTTMAFGMPPKLDRYRSCVFAWTAYAAEKRAAERVARRRGRRRSVEVFVFRLGQVHGPFQRVSVRLARQIAEGRPVSVTAKSSCVTDVVFTGTIAQALENVGAGLERPGTYSIVEQPGLTLAELYAFYARRTGRPVDVCWMGGGAPRAGGSRELSSILLGALARPPLAGLKELLVAQLLPRVSKLEARIRARHLAASARRQLAEVPRVQPVPEYYRQGPVPGPRLASLAAGAGGDASGFDWLEGRWGEAVGPSSRPTSCSG